MSDKLAIYKCNVCSQVIEVCVEGAGELTCCNENMELLKENIAERENAHFAHIEQINENETRITFNHPMTPEHYIEFAELISKDLKHVKRKYFSFEEKPEMIIKCTCKEGFDARVYCNIHNVWKTQG